LGRIAFKVTSKINSRTILDKGGAEQLACNGDMLISINNDIKQVQCAYVSSSEVERVVEFISKQPGYQSAFLLPEIETEEEYNTSVIDLVNRDKLFNDCARAIVQTQNGSSSNLQCRFNLGYNRAGRIMDQLEAAGIVGPTIGSKPRDVYYMDEFELEQFLRIL
jgi:S-DNA-T family DNA segregation ATPase FtsK/SpoIIIE